MQIADVEPVATSVERGGGITSGNDSATIESWLHGRSRHTVRAYRADVVAFQNWFRKPLEALTLDDLQAYAGVLVGCDATVARRLGAIRSLLRFAHKSGKLSQNAGAALLVPKGRDGLADRILTERQVRKLRKAAAASPRDCAIVELLYQSAFRVAEICSLKWSDISIADDGSAFMTVCGKRKKTRTVRVTKLVWAKVHCLRGEAEPADRVFAGRSGSLDPATVWRVVRKAARAAGIVEPVSPHFLRHSHASHALDNGAPIALVRDTLGHDSLATTSRYVHARPSESSGRYLK